MQRSGGGLLAQVDSSVGLTSGPIDLQRARPLSGGISRLRGPEAVVLHRSQAWASAEAPWCLDMGVCMNEEGCAALQGVAKLCKGGHWGAGARAGSRERERTGEVGRNREKKRGTGWGRWEEGAERRQAK